jgi:hypothetical protein
VEVAVKFGEKTGRTPEGRFAPGVSGNPAGRPKGSLNKRTLLEQALREGEALALARVVIEDGLGGGLVSARTLFNRLEPPRRGVRIPFDLPADPRNFQACFVEVLRALFAGQISGDEALPIGKFLVAQSGIQHYYPPKQAEVDEAAGITETDPGSDEIPAEAEAAAEAVPAAADVSSPALAQAELALPRQAEAELPPRASGGGEGGGSLPPSAAPADAVPAESSPSPPSPALAQAELPPQTGEGEGDGGTAAAPAPAPDEEFERRDRLWRAGLLAGPELFAHVDEKRRRGQYVNGLERGFRTVYVSRETL